MNNKTNTRKGIKVRYLFANSILNHPIDFQIMQKKCNIPIEIKANKPQIIGGNKRKTGVEITFKNRNYPPIRVSVKSFAGSGYNHVERRGFLAFCQHSQINKSDCDFLKMLWLRKARDTNTQLVQDAERERVKDIFLNIEPALSALKGNDHPQFLALYNMNESWWKIYDIDKQVAPLMRRTKIGFTSRASNITIGNYMVIQRKGSIKGEHGKDPYHISHGSNNVQIKMKVKKFFEETTPLCHYRCNCTTFLKKT